MLVEDKQVIHWNRFQKSYFQMVYMVDIRQVVFSLYHEYHHVHVVFRFLVVFENE